MHLKTQLLAAAGTLAVCASVPTAALAQRAETQTAQLGEVIVTAQRRGENLQQVPISVSTASATQLDQAGIRSIGDLATIAPSVTFNAGIGGGTITIRGVGGTGAGSDEPSNAIYLDGVYQGSPTNMLFAFNNIERIEVLKGPQGTLFGRNASGGLIQVITRQPQFAPELKADLGYGNYKTFRGSVYGTAPLGDKVAVNLAAVWDRPGEGWGKNLATGHDAYKGENVGVRSKILWNVDDRTSLVGAFLYTHNVNANVQGAGLLPGTRTSTGFTQPAGFFNTNSNFDAGTKGTQHNYALTVKHEFEGFTFSSISSYEHDKTYIGVDIDRSPVPLLQVVIRSTNDVYTQELQLASPASSKVQWALGAFYFNNALDAAPRNRVTGIPFGPTGYSDTVSNAKTESYAAYGQATVPVGEKTKFTAGLRYTEDKRSISFTTSGSPPIPTVVYPNGSADNSKLTWRLALDHQLQDNVLLYASYSRGFKSGLFNNNPPPVVVQPQTVDAYEIGAKSQWADGRVRLNVAAYYNDLKNLQVKGFRVGDIVPSFYNAPGATIKGVDFELQAVVTSQLTFQANVAYTNSRYADGFTGALFITIPPTPTNGIISGKGDASGNQLALAPEWVGSLSAQYVIPTAAGDVVLTGAYTYNGKMYYDPQNLVRRPVVNIFNATASWKATDAITLEAWGNNLTDEHYYAQTESQAPNHYAYYPAAPRTYGVTFKYAYH